MNGPAASPWCQRWRHQQQSWRHLSEGGFDGSRYDVGPLDEPAARRFLAIHHYAGASYPAALRRYGLTERETGKLVGVLVAGAPTNDKVLTCAFPTLEPYRQSAEVSRLALIDDVLANGETWFLARVLRQLLEEGFRGLVSFADPMPRWNSAGQLTKRGHVGAVYMATAGALYTGRGTARTLTLLPDGTVLNARSAQKVRAQDQGHRYVEQRLVDLGAAPPRPGQDRAVWMAEALHSINARRERHGGNHRYLFRLGRSERDRRATRIGLAIVEDRPRQPDLSVAGRSVQSAPAVKGEQW